MALMRRLVHDVTPSEPPHPHMMGLMTKSNHTPMPIRSRLQAFSHPIPSSNRMRVAKNVARFTGLGFTGRQITQHYRDLTGKNMGPSRGGTLR